jgi:hemerythrin-like domain-containing protein
MDIKAPLRPGRTMAGRTGEITMASITDLMSHDHRECDELYARAENAASKGDWNTARTELQAFIEAVEAHFAAEENIIFPRFEAASGMTGGPTQMMRHEHVEMRKSFDSMTDALDRQDRDDFAGEGETLLIMMQQHNMKEENILYPMCDTHLGREMSTLGPEITRQLKASGS